jgi:hypothetical protein
VQRQGPHDVIQALAHQDDLPMLGQPLAQLGHAFGPELALEYILKILFAKQIQAVASHAPQEGVQDSGRHYPVGCVQGWASQGLQEKTSATRPSLGKGVRIPGEVGDWAHSRQIREAAFYAPEDGPVAQALTIGQRHTHWFA